MGGSYGGTLAKSAPRPDGSYRDSMGLHHAGTPKPNATRRSPPLAPIAPAAAPPSNQMAAFVPV